MTFPALPNFNLSRGPVSQNFSTFIRSVVTNWKLIKFFFFFFTNEHLASLHSGPRLRKHHHKQPIIERQWAQTASQPARTECPKLSMMKNPQSSILISPRNILTVDWPAIVKVAAHISISISVKPSLTRLAASTGLCTRFHSVSSDVDRK